MKRVWLDFHRWVGLKLSILMSFVLITGTLATVSHEIDWLLDPGRRVLPTVTVDQYDWQGMVDAAREARPDWSLEWIAAPIDPWFAAEAVGLTADGERRRLLIHPATLAVQGEAGWFNAQRLFREAHRRLMIFHPAGIALVSALSILLILSFVSGLFLYKKFWRGFFRKPRTRDSRTLWGDLHRLGGVWSLWFIVVIALTSVWYLVEVVSAMAGARIGGLPDPSPPPAVARAVDAIGQATGQTTGETAVSLTALSLTAREVIPGYRVQMVHLPRFAGDPVMFHGQASAILVRRRANQVHFDPRTGAMLAFIDAQTLGTTQRIAEMADPLHFGTFGGIWTKLLYFVFGVILSAMSLSGIYIFSARIRKAQQGRQAPVRAAAVAPRGVSEGA